MSFRLLLASLALALPASAQLVFFNEANAGGVPKEFRDLDLGTGTNSLRSTLPTSQRFFSLTRQPSTGTIFATDASTSNLYTVDIDTGIATLVGATGFSTLADIAFDPTTGALYGLDRNNFQLRKIDPGTGTSSLIGTTTTSRTGLFFDAGGQMYGFSLFGALHRINKATGAEILIGGSGISLLEDATYTSTGKVYVTNWGGTVHEVNLGTGANTLVHTTGFASGLTGILEGKPGTPPPVVYCKAKVNSLGCTPAIGSIGSASASATSGFAVTCSMVRNQKTGLLFYAVNGGQANISFQCGILCLKPGTIKRTPAQSAGGTAPPVNDCSGLYSLDMNCFAAGLCGGSPDPGLQVQGNSVQCQWWGRDQGFQAPCNTTLSDALDYVIGA